MSSPSLLVIEGNYSKQPSYIRSIKIYVVLVDSEYLCNLALQKLLYGYGIQISAEQLLLKYRGFELAETLRQLEDTLNQTFGQNFIPNYRSLLNQLFEKELQAINGAKELVIKLNDLALPFCVASNGPLGKMVKSLTITGLIQYLPANRLFSAFEINSWKPQPDLFLHAAKVLQVFPHQCAVVEDSITGLNAAFAANMHPIFLHNNATEARHSGVQYIRSLSEIPDFLCV